MKRSRSIKRRRKGALYLLFAVSTFLAFDMYSGTVYRDIVVDRLNSFLPDKVGINVEKIEGGILRDIISSGVTISHPNLKKPFKFERIELPYRIWDPLIKIYKGAFPKRDDDLKIFIDKDNTLLNGYFALSGSVEDLSVLGSFWILKDKTNHTITGEISHVKDSLYALGIKLDNFTDINGLVDYENSSISLDMKNDKGSILASAYISDDNKVIVSAGLKHVDFKGIDIVAESKSVIEPKEDKALFDIYFSNVIINYTPFKDIKIEGEYIYSQKLISIKSVSIKDKKPDKDVIKGSGKISLLDKIYIDLNLKINNLELEEFVMTKYKEELAKGIMNGEIRVKGELKKPDTYIHFDVQNGKIQDLDFQSLIVTLKGKGPFITVEDGQIVKEGGNLVLSGEADFNRWREGKAFDNMKIETDNRICVWSGWEISRRFETSKVKAEKKIAKDITFTFEAAQDKNMLVPDPVQDENEIGVEYKLHKNESFKMKLKNEEGFLGLEHKIKF